MDEERPPKTRRLHSDKNLPLIPSKRFAAFARAVNIAWRPWLEQLTQNMRKAVAHENMPENLYAVIINCNVFTILLILRVVKISNQPKMVM